MSDLDCDNIDDFPAPIEDSTVDDESNPDHDSTISFHHSVRQAFANNPEELAMPLAKAWEQRKVLNVVFLANCKNYSVTGKELSAGKGEVTDTFKNAVKRYTKIREQHCNIRLKFDQEANGDIRVGFGQGEGNYSMVGTDAKQRKPDQRTMNLGFPVRTEEGMRRATLHEFGHALGCSHEHQSPKSPIKWKDEVVVAAYKSRGKPRSTAVHNVLRMNTGKDKNFLSSPFDEDSIMLYTYPSSWMSNPDCYKTNTILNSYLSVLDVAIIKEMYPPSAQSKGCHTTSTDGPVRHKNPTRIEVTDADDQSPTLVIAIGLSSLHVEANSNVRIRSSVTDIGIQDFILHIDSWADTKFNRAGFNWLETVEGSCFRVGQFNTIKCRGWDDKNRKPEASIDVVFDRKFKDAPTIVVRLNWIDTDKAHDTIVKTYATHITPTGFKIHVDSSGDCVMYSGGATWIAYPGTVKNISSAVIENTTDTAKPKHQQTAPVKFTEGSFKRKPKAGIAVSSIDFAKGNDVDFDGSVTDIDQMG